MHTTGLTSCTTDSLSQDGSGHVQPRENGCTASENPHITNLRLFYSVSSTPSLNCELSRGKNEPTSHASATFHAQSLKR